MTTTTTLIGTFSSLGSFGIVIVKLIGLILNMFCISIFLGHFLVLCSAFEHIIQGYWTCILTSLTCCVLVLATSFVDLIVVIHTTSTSFFQIYQVSRLWPILPQLIQVDVDLTQVTTSTTGLVTILTFGVVSNAS